MDINTLTVGLPHGLFVILGAGGGKIFRRSSFSSVTKERAMMAAVVKDHEHGYQQPHS